jgi:hypothetical protein
MPIHQPKREPVHHSVPDYEAFHRETIPPPPPITRIKPVTNGIPVAIIIDDIGYDRKMADGFLALDVPLTFSVLPMGTFNDSIIRKARQQDVEIMLHQPMGGFHGQAADVEIHAREILKMKETLNNILATHTGQSLKKIQTDTDRDFFMSGEEAKDYGIVDEVITSIKDGVTSGKAG